LFDSLPHPTSNGGSFAGTISFTLLPKQNVDGSDDSLHDGTCAKTIGTCDCTAKGCSFDFTLNLDITDFAGKTVPQGEDLQWGFSNTAGQGTPDHGVFPFDETTGIWGSHIASEPLVRTLACGNKDEEMTIVIGTDTEVWASAKVHFHCPDCPNNLPPQQ